MRDDSVFVILALFVFPIDILFFLVFSFASCPHATRIQKGHTALIHAAIRGRIDCVRVLLEFKADKESNDDVRVLRIYHI